MPTFKPTFISIAVESPPYYIAVDRESNVWRGRLIHDPGNLDPMVIEWEPVKSDFPAPPKLWGSGPSLEED
jgi:hypothetical protein